ncbi:MAG: pseudouridine-5'-phosphate glycosidase [Deltaproteobacteria bacterium]|nr:pseudouridine-5'-phosphate glycosidase [Deltaproteobacteria bacterium]
MSIASTPPIVVSPEVREALAEGHPVIGLESVVLTHGLPAPENSQSAWRAARAAREAGVVSATIGVIDGKIRVGLHDEELKRLADPEAPCAKLGVRDLAVAMVKGLTGGTTVSATAWIASRVGIRVMATGAIGGVHPGWSEHGDVSSDLIVLSQAPVAIVSAGAKAVLDLPATLERLESLAVPVVGLRTAEFPGFYYNETGLPLELVAEDEAEVARIFRAHRAIGRKGGLLVANEVPRAVALEASEVQGAVEAATARAREEGVHGKALTPFLLESLREQLGPGAVAVNLAILEANARAAANLACHVAREVPPPPLGQEGA